MLPEDHRRCTADIARVGRYKGREYSVGVDKDTVVDMVFER